MPASRTDGMDDDTLRRHGSANIREVATSRRKAVSSPARPMASSSSRGRVCRDAAHVSAGGGGLPVRRGSEAVRRYEWNLFYSACSGKSPVPRRTDITRQRIARTLRARPPGKSGPARARPREDDARLAVARHDAVAPGNIDRQAARARLHRVHAGARRRPVLGAAALAGRLAAQGIRSTAGVIGRRARRGRPARA